MSVMHVRESRKLKLRGYVGEITIDPRLEGVKIVVFEGAFTQQSLP